MLDIIVRSLTRKKMRTGLTIFGIALGIFATTVMGGMSEYMNGFIDKSMDLMADDIQIQPDGTFGGIGTLDESNIMKIRRIPGVKDSSGVLVVSLDPDSPPGFTGGNMVFGVDPEKQDRIVKLTSGRYMITGDGYNAVIGSSIARKFNLNVGDELQIKNKRTKRSSSPITYARNVTVVGIMEHTGSMFDDSVQMPLDRAQKFYNMENTVSFIYATPMPGVDAEDLSRRIELNIEKVKSDSPKKLREIYEGQIAIFSLITVSAAVLAAIIGGLSVMNTMLMSVSERTKEFGLLKALGAERKSILIMTMGESAIIGIIGGIFGIIAGIILTSFLNNTFEATQGSALFSITPRLIMVGLLFATFLGTVCGIYPAYRATRLSPMEALRYE